MGETVEGPQPAEEEGENNQKRARKTAAELLSEAVKQRYLPNASYELPDDALKWVQLEQEHVPVFSKILWYQTEKCEEKRPVFTMDISTSSLKSMQIHSKQLPFLGPRSHVLMCCRKHSEKEDSKPLLRQLTVADLLSVKGYPEGIGLQLLSEPGSRRVVSEASLCAAAVILLASCCKMLQ